MRSNLAVCRRVYDNSIGYRYNPADVAWNDTTFAGSVNHGGDKPRLTYECIGKIGNRRNPVHCIGR